MLDLPCLEEFRSSDKRKARLLSRRASELFNYDLPNPSVVSLPKIRCFGKIRWLKREQYSLQ